MDRHLRRRLTTALLPVALAAVVAVGLTADRQALDRAFVIDRFTLAVVVAPDGTTTAQEELLVTFRDPRRGIVRVLPREPGFDAVSREEREVRDQIAMLRRQPPPGRPDLAPDEAQRAWEQARIVELETWLASRPPPPAHLRTYAIVAHANDAPTEGFSASRTPTGDLELRFGDAARTLPTGTYRYQLHYDGPSWTRTDLRDTGRTETRIDVPGFGWPTTVAATTVRLDLPGPIDSAQCVQGRVGATRSCDAQLVVSGSTLTAELGPYPDHSGATIAVTVAGEHFTQAPLTQALPALDRGARLPRWHVPRLPAAIGLALLLAVPGLLVLRLEHRRIYARVTDPALEARILPAALPHPPDGLDPTQVAGLLHRRRADDLLLAALVTASQRGALDVEVPADGTGLVLRRGPTPESDPTGAVALLLPQAAPVTVTGAQDDELAARFTAARRMLRERAGRVFEDQGLLHHEGGWLGTAAGRAWLLVGLGFGGLLVAVIAGIVVPLGSTAALQVAGIVAAALLGGRLLWAGRRRPLSSAGRDRVRQAEAFRAYLVAVEREPLGWAAQEEPDERHPALALLPYAIALGLGDAWYARFAPLLHQQQSEAWWTDPVRVDRVLATERASRRPAASGSVDSTSSGASVGSGGGGFGGGGAGSGGGGGGGRSW